MEGVSILDLSKMIMPITLNGANNMISFRNAQREKAQSSWQFKLTKAKSRRQAGKPNNPATQNNAGKELREKV